MKIQAMVIIVLKGYHFEQMKCVNTIALIEQRFPGASFHLKSICFFV